jgi:hypothetical protein
MRNTDHDSFSGLWVGLSLSILLLLAVAGCGQDENVLPDSKPDLVASSVTELPCDRACYPLRIEVCVLNSGAVDAGAFTVTVNRQDRARFEGLSAGAEECRQLQYFFESPVEPDDPADPRMLLASFDVDTYFEVPEESEMNNKRTFPLPSGTRCDIICGDAIPTRMPTPPPPR